MARISRPASPTAVDPYPVSKHRPQSTSPACPPVPAPPSKATGNPQVNAPPDSMGREMYQDRWINDRDGGPRDVRGGRPCADEDRQRNLENFHRTELSSREPNRGGYGSKSRG